MAYLARSAERRADVRRVLPSARSVIVTATVYNTDRPYSTECADPSRAHVARYAWGDDYHDVIGARLEALLAWMRERSPEPFEARAYVDTGPVQERVYARHAGIGWIGKNTCVINPELGSWIFLGEIICSLPLDADAPAFDQCGTCTLCLEACPTQALVAPGVLDSNALHFVPDHRASRRDRSGALARRHRLARLRLRHLPGSLPVERDRADLGRSGVAAAAGVGSAVARRPRPRCRTKPCSRRSRAARWSRAKPAGLRRNIRIAERNAARSKLHGTRPAVPDRLLSWFVRALSS